MLVNFESNLETHIETTRYLVQMYYKYIYIDHNKCLNSQLFNI